MKSQVRGPTCASAFQSYVNQFEDGKDISIQVLAGGFKEWKHVYGDDKELTNKV